MTKLKAITMSACVAVGALVAAVPVQAFFGLDNPLGGAASGALIGGIAGGGKGAAIGAVSGAVVGAVVEDSKKQKAGGQQ